MTSPKWKNPAAFEDVCEVLEDIVAMINEGRLVRDTSRDGDGAPSWMVQYMNLVARLLRADTALSRARGETEEG